MGRRDHQHVTKKRRLAHHRGRSVTFYAGHGETASGTNRNGGACHMAQASLNTISAEPVYDALVSLLVIHFIEKRQLFLEEVARKTSNQMRRFCWHLYKAR
ncbi:hypothetical protein ACEQPO_29325 [Bacillus sp. SL00103]